MRKGKRGRDMHGRSSWTCKGGDEKERCREAFKKKSERAILSPFPMFFVRKMKFYEKWYSL